MQRKKPVKTVQLVALRQCPYAHRTYKPGDIFEAESADARVLVHFGAARPITVRDEEPPLESADLKTEGHSSGKDKKRYKTRELRAEQ